VGPCPQGRRHVLKAVDTEDLSLIDREIDWATKLTLIERYRDKRDHHCPLRVAQMDLAYHDIRRKGSKDR
jgi:proteasome accessory factor A